MAIDILRESSIKSLPDSIARVRATKANQNTAVEEKPALNAPSLDDVVFTEDAKALSQATEIARNSDGVDYDKVARIKQQLAEGSYKIDFERTAEKFMESAKELSFLY